MMTQNLQIRKENRFRCLCMDDLVPQDHLLRLIGPGNRLEFYL